MQKVVTYLLLVAAVSCTVQRGTAPPRINPAAAAEHLTALELYPGVTATIAAPAGLDLQLPVELILYALPNGNSTAETMGRRMADGVGWRHDIQHIGAQTRALRAAGIPQAVVVYLEADTRSWPEWRRVHSLERANTRIVEIVDQLRVAIGNPSDLAVTLTGHSGGGSFTWGFIDGLDALPDWLRRIAFLDSNYSFEPRHGDRIAEWLRRDTRNTLVVLAYDDREVTLDGRRIVSDSGGTWRATERMLAHLSRQFPVESDTLGEFLRHHHPQIEVLLHPNPENRILHTAMIGELNGYMHALLVRRPGHDGAGPVLGPGRAYEQWIEDDVRVPAPVPPQIPPRPEHAPTGSAFIVSLEGLTREQREEAIRRELFTGNVPGFLRTSRTVTVRASGADSVERTVTLEVMPDYLAIGSDADFVRMPMDPHTAQAFCDAFGFVLPTRKVVNDVWSAADVHIEPHPLTEERESPRTFLEHHRLIEAELGGAQRGALVAGIKKDVVVSNRLRERADRVAIFGWHRRNGEPIQPLYPGHVDWYVDYSHGIRPVRRRVLVDGQAHTFEAVLRDPVLHPLLSDEGPIPVPRYQR